ncbi:MAG: response regulator [Elusimicrobia bacterium]|nr:response regulator [Elusimicrobiota bacterium]
MARILVVDDERDVVTLIKFLLEKDGHEVAEASHGADALAKLGVDPKREGVQLPDLIIVDVMMPVMDGYTTATRLRDDPSTRSLPLIVLTAKGQTRELFQLAPNVAAHIEKPFDPKNLRELVTGMLAGKNR